MAAASRRRTVRQRRWRIGASRVVADREGLDVNEGTYRARVTLIIQVTDALALRESALHALRSGISTDEDGAFAEEMSDDVPLSLQLLLADFASTFSAPGAQSAGSDVELPEQSA